jgi:hypothetical protein
MRFISVKSIDGTPLITADINAPAAAHAASLARVNVSVERSMLSYPFANRKEHL